MAQEFAKAFYNSKAWKECRESYIISVHGLCEECAKHEKITPGLIVHHKIRLTPENINDPKITLNHKHLKYDCLECHNKEESKNNDVVREGLMFDSNGDLIPIAPL